MLKKVYALETYALLGGDENYVIMAVIAHNQTEKDTFEILQALYEDAKIDEESAFIMQWI